MVPSLEARYHTRLGKPKTYFDFNDKVFKSKKLQNCIV